MTARDSPGLLLGPGSALIGQQLAWPGCDWLRAGRALDKFGEGLERAESRHQTWGNYEAELRAVMTIISDIMVKQEIVSPQSQSKVSNPISKIISKRLIPHNLQPFWLPNFGHKTGSHNHRWRQFTLRIRCSFLPPHTSQSSAMTMSSCPVT